MLQRLFYWFPGGHRGVALLLLRIAGGGAAGIDGGLYLSGSVDPTLAVWIVGLAAISGGMSLFAGFLTPAASVTVSLTAVMIEVRSVQSAAELVALDHLGAFLLIANAV